MLFALAWPLWHKPNDRCAPLRESVELVRTGAAAGRVSDVWLVRGRLEKYGWRHTTMVAESGDFAGRLDRISVRACLGAQWREARVFSTFDWADETWAYEREGWPRVTYLEASANGFRSQVVITPAE